MADLEADIEDTTEPWESADDDISDVDDATQDNGKKAIKHNGMDEVEGIESMREEENDPAGIATEFSLSDAGNNNLLPVPGAARPIPVQPNLFNVRGEDTTGSIGESLSTAQTPSNTLHDPRAVTETLEGVVTPRNEAGPFVFNGTVGRGSGPITTAAPAGEAAT